MIRIFVYGTLKAGFPNHQHNQGVWVATATTTDAYPLCLVGPRHSPWLLDQPGQGYPVTGEVFEVDEAGLARMDRLERVAEPDGYRRRTVSVVAEEGEEMTVEIYLKPPEQLAGKEISGGYSAQYTLEMAAHYRPRQRVPV